LNQDKEKENLEESKKFSIVGSKVDQCLMLKFITLSVPLKNNSKKFSQLISLVKVLTKLEVGSTLLTPLRQESKI